MAKEKSTDVESKNNNINSEFKKKKKKLIVIIGTIAILIGTAVGFFGFSAMQNSKASKAETEKELLSVPLSEYPLEEESTKTYTRDISKQTYLLKDGALLFEGTMVFHNNLCANLYAGIIDRTEQIETEFEDVETPLFGDKLVKDVLNKFLQENSKSTLASAEKLSIGLKDAINKRFKDTYGHEILSDILVTNHIIQ